MAKYELDKELYLGEKSITIGKKTINFPSPIQSIETFYEDLSPKFVKIVIMFGTDNVNKTPNNNLHCYNAEGDCLWDIGNLINEYKATSHINLCDTQFYQLKKLNFELIHVFGTSCHYYIHVGKGKIIYLEGQR